MRMGTSSSSKTGYGNRYFKRMESIKPCRLKEKTPANLEWKVLLVNGLNIFILDILSIYMDPKI
jgi:hypothetical protein